MFVYKALLESFQQGSTIIPASRFSSVFERLRQKEGGRSQLEEQFEMLCGFDPQHPATSVQMALFPENAHKNRDANLAASKGSKL